MVCGISICAHKLSECDQRPEVTQSDKVEESFKVEGSPMRSTA